MSASPAHVPTFSWKSFALTAALIVIVVGLVACGYHAVEGRWDPLFLILGAWVLAFHFYTWRRLRQEKAEGRFNFEEYRKDAVRYVRGPLLPYRLWIGSLVLAVLVLALIRSLD